MNVSLTPEHEKYVHNKVKSGKYATASEVVREGLRLLQEKDQLYELRIKKLREEIEVGWQQARAGQLIDGEVAMRHIWKQVQKSAAKKKKR